MDHIEHVAVLRIGHRPTRDKRVTTHVCLTARAFGVKKAYLSGKKDLTLERTMKIIVERWGGDFRVNTGVRLRDVIKKWRESDGIVVHLTMYGLPIETQLPRIQAIKRPILVIVGSEKVQREVFHLSDYNISVGNQPHSEIAALAVFLDRLKWRTNLPDKFPCAKMRIIPQKRGKKVLMIE